MRQCYYIDGNNIYNIFPVKTLLQANSRPESLVLMTQHPHQPQNEAQMAGKGIKDVNIEGRRNEDINTAGHRNDVRAELKRDRLSSASSLGKIFMLCSS